MFDLPELQYPDRLNCVTELLDRWIASGHGDRPCLISPAETLTYAQLAERVNRIANVLTRDLGLVPGNRVLLRAPNSPMMVAAYLAVIKAGGVVVATMPLLRAKEIAYPLGKAKIAPRAVRPPPRRRDGEGAGTRPRPRARRLLGRRHGGRPRSDDAEARLRALHRLRHRERRRLPDRLHLRHHRRAEGHDAFPSRHAGDLRQLRPACAARAASPTASSARRRSPSRSGSAGWCCFRCASAPRPCCSKKPRPDDLLAAIGKHRATDLLHRADRLSRDAREARRARHLLAAQAGVRRRGAAEGHVRGLARRHRPEDPRRHRRDRDAAHLHRLAAGRDPRRARPAGRCPATRRAWSTTNGRDLSARHHRPPRGARTDRLPLPRRQAPAAIRARRLEHHRRHLPDGCRRLLLVPGALRRHDRLGRLQHRRAGGRSRRCSRIRRWPNAAWSARPTRTAARS